MTKNNDVHRHYLHDLGVLIREMAEEARAQADTDGRTDFDVGYLTALHHVVSLMQQQADAFDLPLVQLGLQDLDPDAELL